MQLTASLVLYKNDPEIVIQAIRSLFSTPIEINLLVVDNSPTDELKKIFDDFQEYNIDYYFNNGNNVGFGQGHNLAITRSKKYDYHLVINPDVYFDNNVITELIHYLDKHQDVGLITPKISYPKGDIQYLCKRQPTVLTLFKGITPLDKISDDHLQCLDSFCKEVVLKNFSFDQYLWKSQKYSVSCLHEVHYQC